MSKARQRRESFYDQGYQDKMKGRPYRWKQHGYLMFYKNGWDDATNDIRTAERQGKPLRWWEKLFLRLCGGTP